MKERIPAYDAVAAVFILEIIAMHIFQWGRIDYMNTPVVGPFFKVFFFFMPYFYFKAGVFHKDGEAWDLTASKSYQRLIVPYLVFTVLGLLVSLPFEWAFSGRAWYKVALSPFKQILVQGSCVSGLALWFLASLFFVKLLFRKIVPGKLEKAFVFFPLAGWLLSAFELRLPLGLQSLFPGIFFYYSGYFYQRNEKLRSGGVVLTAALLFLAVQILFPSRVDMRTNHLEYGGYLVWLLASLAGILVLMRIAFFLPAVCKVLAPVGTRSMSYYVSHWLVLVAVTQLLNVFKWPCPTSCWGYVVTISPTVLVSLWLIDFCLRQRSLNWTGVYPKIKD